MAHTGTGEHYRLGVRAAYVDLKAAFDSVDRLALWKALRGIGTPSIILNLISDLHTGTLSRVRLANDSVSDSFATTSGVHRAAGLYPGPGFVLSRHRLDHGRKWASTSVILGTQTWTMLTTLCCLATLSKN